jgi:hypothetical protein
MLRRSGQPSEVLTCEVSFNLVRHARIDKIQWDRTKFDENGQCPCELLRPRMPVWLSHDTQVGPLPANSARSVVLPLELARGK